MELVSLKHRQDDAGKSLVFTCCWNGN